MFRCSGCNRHYHYVCAQVKKAELTPERRCHICLSPDEQLDANDLERQSTFKKRQRELRKLHRDANEDRQKLILRKLDIFAPFLTQVQLQKLRAAASANKFDLTDDDDLRRNDIHHCTSSQPSYITATLRPYQVEGVNWFISSYDCGMGCILGSSPACYHTRCILSLVAGR